MNQKLSDRASIAEIVSGIGVIVTLIVLVFGIRENTAITRASMYSDMITSFNEQMRPTYADPAFSRLYDSYYRQATAELDAVDQRRLQILVGAGLKFYESAYFAREYGVVGDAEWRRHQAAICVQRERAEAAGVYVTQTIALTEEFREFMTTLCTAPEAESLLDEVRSRVDDR